MFSKIMGTVGLIIIMSTTQSHASDTLLPLCPNSPNCVSSQAADNSHFIAPFKIITQSDEAWTALKQALLSQPRTLITKESTQSLDAEATSFIFRFVDDIKIIFDRDKQLIHIRSASRIGYSDFGVNRQRVEQLRTALKNAGFIE